MLSRKFNTFPWYWVSVSITLAVLDQIIKNWCIYHLPFKQLQPIFPGIALYFTYNTGIAFSLFKQTGNIPTLLMIISMIVSVTLFYEYTKKSTSFLVELGFANILGGGLGNLYDRFTREAIVDFISVYIGNWHSPIFNVADVFIIIGFLCILLSQVSYTKKIHFRKNTSILLR